MSNLNNHEIHALSFETEYDFRRKSGPIELVCVFKASGGYDVYHPSDVPHIIEKLPDEKIALHKGQYREGRAKAKFDSELKKIDGDIEALKKQLRILMTLSSLKSNIQLRLSLALTSWI